MILLTTKELIQKQFIEEYEKKEYTRITVKELCANTPVARTTFYSYYQNINDVKEDTENNLITGITEIAIKFIKRQYAGNGLLFILIRNYGIY